MKTVTPAHRPTTAKAAAPETGPRRASALLGLQRSIGNAAVGRLLRASAGRIQRETETGPGGPRERSAWNLVMVGWQVKDVLDDALVGHVNRVKQEFEDFDEAKLLEMARAAVLPLLARFVPGLGTALLIKDLVDLGMDAAETLDSALRAETDEERAKVARALADVFVVWAIGVALRKLAGAIRQKAGAKMSVHETAQNPSTGQPGHSNNREPTPPPGTAKRSADLRNYRPAFSSRIKEELAAHESGAPYGHLHDPKSKHRLRDGPDGQFDRRHIVPYSKLRDDFLTKLEGLSNREKAEVLANAGPGFHPKTLSDADIKKSTKAYLRWLHDDYTNLWVGPRGPNRALGARPDPEPREH